MGKNKPANKIIPTNRFNLKSTQTMSDAILKGIPKKDREAARKRLIKKSKKVRMEKGFWKTPQGKISKSARNAQKLQIKNQLKQQLKQLTDLSKQVGKQAYKNRLLELADPSRISPERWTQLSSELDHIKRRSRRWDRIEQLRNKKMRLGALKSGLGNLGAGIVLNALSDKYLAPLAEKAGTKLGKSLIPVGRKIDQLLMRKQKDGD